MRIYVAGYPEGHCQNPSKADSLQRDIEKAKLGAQGIITQLFFSNDLFFDYANQIRQSGYNGELIPGIFPLYDAKQALRLTELCGASIPAVMKQALEKWYDNSAALEGWGADYAASQIQSLHEAGFNQPHIYVMNRSQSLALMNL